MVVALNGSSGIHWLSLCNILLHALVEKSADVWPEFSWASSALSDDQNAPVNVTIHERAFLRAPGAWSGVVSINRISSCTTSHGPSCQVTITSRWVRQQWILLDLWNGLDKLFPNVGNLSYYSFVKVKNSCFVSLLKKIKQPAWSHMHIDVELLQRVFVAGHVRAKLRASAQDTVGMGRGHCLSTAISPKLHY